jgi:hypothetical protein
MSNKILDHIEHVILHGEDRRAARNMNFTVRTVLDDTALDATRQHKIKAKLEVYFEQYIDAMATDEARQIMRERSKAAIARHLYGDILDEVRDTMEAAWEEGLPDDSPLLKKLSALRASLAGRMTRFE